ncbi:MAG: helix-turn-helix domain-containing protein, partial [Lachnospiraceae bacterium]|nr:helix-turn-helix domain-containing protein [Lachnospiraceae bacterium]
YRNEKEENDMIHIGDNVRIARKRKGRTQEELAGQIGVTSQAVSRWESGAGLPDISLIVPIAQVLSVSTDMLFGLDNGGEDNQLLIQITNKYQEIESRFTDPKEAALEKCNYLEAELDRNLGSFVIATCLVERTADLSRYADFENFQCDWDIRKNKALSAGMQVIRFCDQKMWVERTHYALAWIYIHEKDFVSAREHIEHLPSVKENRLQESILAQVASFEQGVEGMKSVLRNNLQNMTRVINKEILYAVEDMSWSDTPENAVEFASWGINLMRQLCEKKELIPYCRGFFRDVYKYMLHADLRMENYDLAKKHWQELCEGMQMHYSYYQEVLNDEILMGLFVERQINYMRNYTQEFISEKQDAIKERLREWHGKEKLERFIS